MRTLHIDLETYSSVNLKECGIYKYVESEDFEILLFAYAYENESVNVIDLASGETIPNTIKHDILDLTIQKVAHNAAFERICLSKYLGQQLQPNSWHCTMVHASMLGLPASLDAVSKCLGFPEDKQKMSVGKRLISYFCKPCKPTKANNGRRRNYPEDDPEKWKSFIEYNRQDVVVEQSIYTKLQRFPIPPLEHRVWCMDQRMNDYGIQIDTDMVETILNFSQQHDIDMALECESITGGLNLNSLAQLKHWISKNENRPIEFLTKDAVIELLNGDLTADTRRVLELRQEAGKTSVKKYDAIGRAVCSDGRIHGTLQYYGANRTGRWAGRIFQPQNLPRNAFNDIELARELVKKKEFEVLNMLYPGMNTVFSTLIRSAVIPPQGCKFAVADYSAIEARVIAWLADERWRQDVFSTHGKIYEASASQMFHVPIEEVTKGSDLRKKGKVAELALGYGGGVGALERMGGADMGLDEEEMQEIVSKWRAASPHIVRLWRSAQLAAMSAVREHRAVQVTHGVSFHYRSGILFAKLPSGRELAYVRPRITKGQYGDELTYEGSGMDKGATGKFIAGWCRQKTWGGKLVENLVQAIARDCLALAMLRLTDAGYRIVMHVHDEVIVEVPAEAANDALEKIIAIMGAPIDWAPELYLTTDGFTCDFYKKD